MSGPRQRTRFTTEDAPPLAHCPTCDALVLYRLTVQDGIGRPGTWHYFQCLRCGVYVAWSPVIKQPRTVLAIPWPPPTPKERRVRE